MAFPQVQSGIRYGAETANSTAHSVSMPTDVVADSLILVFFAVDASETLTIDTGISGVNWTREGYQATSPVTAAVYWKIAEGSGSDALTINTTSEAASYVSLEVTDYLSSDPVTVSTAATGSSTNMNPPSLTPLYGAREYLWFVFGAMDGVVSATSAPTDFTNLTVANNSFSQGSTCSVAWREYQYGSAYDPGTFTNNSEDWITFTVIVNANPPAGFGISAFAYYNLA